MGQIKAQTEETTRTTTARSSALAKLSGASRWTKAAGAATEVELKEKKHRIEDAPVDDPRGRGGPRGRRRDDLVAGDPALRQAQFDGDHMVGVDIVRKALEAPARQIADNVGAPGEVVVEKVKGLDKGYGYDALVGEYGDLFEKGIVDAAKVTCSALQNAASIAAMVLTTETVVTDIPEKEGGRRWRPRPRWGPTSRS